MRELSFLLLITSSCLFMACKPSANKTQSPDTQIQNLHQDSVPSSPQLKFHPFDRTAIVEKLRQKINDHTPLIVHAFVPLCDNEHQGIVPVNEQLGDGFNLQTNLYWGAKYGVKNHFKNLQSWQLVYSEKDPTDKVLERVVFAKEYTKNKKVYLIADAYQGDSMEECLAGFFMALSGEKAGNITIEKEIIEGYNKADLLVFNGHNGLMDVAIPTFYNRDSIYKDAIIIACESNSYFSERLNYVKAFPVLTTTNLLAPEAYVLAAAVDHWANLNTGKSFEKEAGAAYNQFQNCGLKGATRLFKNGW